MLMFMMCLNPLLCIIGENVAAAHSGPHNKRTAVIAYADDVTIILRSPRDIPIVQEALGCYEDPSGAKLNIQKSKAMALDSCDTSHTIMRILYHTELRILGIKMTTTVQQSAINSWRMVIGKIRAETRDAYSRTLSLDQRVLYVHNYLLAKAWYTAQILPPPSDCIRQLNTAMSWYLWQDDTFRVPLSTLYRPKDHRGPAQYTQRQNAAPYSCNACKHQVRMQGQ